MDIFESFQKINEQEDFYRNNVEVSVEFESPGLDDDQYVDVLDNVELQYSIDIEERSWGIKDIKVSLQGVVEFDIIIRSNLPDEEGKEKVIPIRIDFSDVTPEINWIEGSGIAPAELHVLVGGEGKVKHVEVDFYYWSP